jgi:glycosyltransferase involved in cell wall biosynthesis
MKVVFCTPTRDKPHAAYLAALEASIPALDAAGIEHSTAFEVGCPYISSAMATLARKALDSMPDAIVFLDDDMSWTPESLVKLIQCPEDVVGGTYRFKKDEVEYMGAMMTTEEGRPIVRPDGLITARWMPSGFLKITANAINKFMKAYPELNCGPAYHPTPDLFNHGAHEGIWYGQDYAFCRNYTAKCGPVFLMPDLDITHHFGNLTFPGNFHEFMLRQPGGSESDNPVPPKAQPEPNLFAALRSAA